jgi:hypothetical protein
MKKTLIALLVLVGVSLFTAPFITRAESIDTDSVSVTNIVSVDEDPVDNSTPRESRSSTSGSRKNDLEKDRIVLLQQLLGLLQQYYALLSK